MFGRLDAYRRKETRIQAAFVLYIHCRVLGMGNGKLTKINESSVVLKEK